MKFRYIIAFSAALLMLGACDNNDSPAKWKPADPSTAAGLYFGNVDNLLSVTVGEDTHVALPVYRLDTEGSLTVPVVVTCSEESLEVPETITFNDGEDCTMLTLNLADIPTKVQVPVSITFPEEYINPYAAGSPVYDGAVIVSDWEQVGDGPVRFEWYDWSYEPTTLFDPIDHVLMHLPGTNRYKFLNFMLSGYDITFCLEPSKYAAWKGYSRIVPLSNYVLYSDYSYSGHYNPWWLTDETHQEWPELQLPARSKTVSLFAPSFMWYDDEYENEYCFVRNAGTEDLNGNVAEINSGYMAFYGFYDESWDWGNFTGYLRIYFEFPPVE